MPQSTWVTEVLSQIGYGTAGDWAEKIGAATFDWLLTVSGKTHGRSSTTHHEGSSGRFSRLDAHRF